MAIAVAGCACISSRLAESVTSSTYLLHTVALARQHLPTLSAVALADSQRNDQKYAAVPELLRVPLTSHSGWQFKHGFMVDHRLRSIMHGKTTDDIREDRW